MKKLLVVFAMVAFTAPAVASDVNVDLVVRQGFEYNMTNETSDWNIGLNYLTVSKSFGDNFVATITPVIEANALVTGDKTYYLNVAEMNFMVNDITKGYADLGISLQVGQRFNPMYNLEEAYYAGNYYAAGLYHGNNITRYSEAGAFLGGNFVDNMVDVSLGVTTGEILFNGNNLSDNNDGIFSHLYLTVKPLEGMEMGDLIIGANLLAAGYSAAESDIAFFIGYKHEIGLTAYVEYIQSYSSTAALNKDVDFSVAASFDLLEEDFVTAGVFARYDYNHDNLTATTYNYMNTILGGVQFKWFESKLKTAVLYDGNKLNAGDWNNGIRIATEVAL